MKGCWNVGRRSVLGLTVTLLIPGGVSAQEPAQRFQRVESTPPWIGTLDSVSFEDLVAYARQATYDTWEAASDVQPMVYRLGDRAAFGPTATIQPRMGAHHFREGDYGNGQVVGQIVTDQVIRSLGIVADTTYVYAQAPIGDGDWQAYLIPSDTTSGLIGVCDLRMDVHPPADSALFATGYWEPVDPGAHGLIFRWHYKCGSRVCCSPIRCTLQRHRATPQVFPG